mmetsp:Transcript_5635/g.20186  ORF Transcript_5635/g.20186 Transcript_5635/m.20186 type:complete len:85 (-) Transcript_5635:1597-1851(-)
MASTVPRHSGLQLRVLSLYRSCMRAAASQPTAASREAATAHVRARFRDASIRRADFQKIEFLVRRGERQLKKMGGGDGFSVARV